MFSFLIFQYNIGRDLRRSNLNFKTNSFGNLGGNDENRKETNGR